MKYDFAGWVTKNNIQCEDGRTIRHSAFVGSPEKVPLLWQHDDTTPENVLGSMTLVHSDEGTYGYGTFNNTESAKHAKEMVKHGDIASLSVRAGKLRQKAMDVVGGVIKEVSLVTRGANPGALIDDIMMHSDDTVSEAIIYSGLSDMIHTADSLPGKPIEGGSKMGVDKTKEVEGSATGNEDKTVQDVLDTLSDEQITAVEIMVGAVIDGLEDEDEEDGVEMKHNSFEGGDYMGAETVSPEQFEEIMHAAIDSKTTLSHAAKEYGISNIDLLFPDAKNTDGVRIFEDKNTNVTKILGSIRKSPFAFVKTIIADINEEYMRAKGYVTATEKYEDVFGLITRKITPTTIYKKQKLDRDDIVDITDVNVPMLVQGTMRGALEKELVRAVLIGDGRAVDHQDKIKEANIIPISKDVDLYTTKYTLETVDQVLESVMYMLTEYHGEGTPSLYCNPVLAVALKLMKTATGKYLFGEIPTLETMAAKMGVAEVVPTSILSKNEFIIVNLGDYSIGTNNGGEVTNFDDFDIDFNQYKYLIETRLSGALTMPKSAFYVNVKSVDVKKPAVLIEGAIPTSPGEVAPGGK